MTVTILVVGLDSDVRSVSRGALLDAIGTVVCRDGQF